jgi:hypothetical protein
MTIPFFVAFAFERRSPKSQVVWVGISRSTHPNSSNVPVWNPFLIPPILFIPLECALISVLFLGYFFEQAKK